MSPGATFERVYLGIREQLKAGCFQPGSHLEPSHLADALNASITPVRDALHRLVGERMIEAPRSDGFRVPFQTEVGLRHLYAWNNTLLALALTRPDVPAANATEALPTIGAEDSPELLAEFVAELFGIVARMSGNPEHSSAVDALSNRLTAVRLVEASVLPGVGAELEELRAALHSNPLNRSDLRRQVTAYHRRRIKSTDAIVAARQQ